MTAGSAGPAPPPAIVLVRPQLGENIGKAARAMLNFGLTDLRLVSPRDGWPNPSAGPAASGADIVLEKARIFDSVAEALAATLVPMGSAGAKAMAVVRGEADIYLHTGGQYEWDNCAPIAVAQAAGLHVSRVDGAPLVYNCADPYLPDLLICRPELADAVLRQPFWTILRTESGDHLLQLLRIKVWQRDSRSRCPHALAILRRTKEA